MLACGHTRRLRTPCPDCVGMGAEAANFMSRGVIEWHECDAGLPRRTRSERAVSEALPDSALESPL